MSFDSVLMDELIDEISMGPFGSDVKVEFFTDTGVPVLNGSNLDGFVMNENNLRFMDPERVEKMHKALATPGDVIITHRGTLGQIVYVPNSVKYPSYLISQSQFRIRFNDRVLPEYVVFYFHTKRGQYELLSNASQVGVPSLARPTSTFRELRILLPNLDNQKKIVNLITGINSKIDFINQINDNLSEQGQAIFNELIINGEAAYEKRLTDIAHFQNGLPMQKNRPIAGEGLPVLKIKELGQGRCDDSSERCRDDIDHSVLINNGDVVFSWSGSLMAKIWCGGKCGLNQHLFKVTSEKYPLWLYYYWLQYHMPDFIDIAANKATTMGHICRNHLDDAIISIPRPEIMKKADSVLSPIINAQIKSMEEITQLTVLRDYLLPKLMSGEIDVSTLRYPTK